MATRKQRRRRAKSQRHDYEVVYLDDEGNEVEPDEAEPSKPEKASSRSTSGSGSTTSRSKSRLVREPKPPSWSRAARRGAIFMPILLAVVLITNRDTKPLAVVPIAIVFTALVIPFGYFTDHLAWRAYQKRVGGKTAGKPTGKSAKR